MCPELEMVLVYRVGDRDANEAGGDTIGRIDSPYSKVILGPIVKTTNRRF